MIHGREGRLPFRSWTLWFGDVGAPDAIPLVFVPGGPGVPHLYFEPLARRAPAGFRLIFYDPTGAGASDRPSGVRFDFELFVDEVAALVQHLGLRRFHLFGSSFGGIVCLGLALRQPAGLVSMTLAATTPSVRAARARVHTHLDTLPPTLREPLKGPVGTPAYMRAYHEYSARFLCRVPLPPAMVQAMRSSNFDAMFSLKGRGLTYDGTLRDLDLTSRLGEIAVPTLVACGHHDVYYPDIYTGLARGLPAGRLAEFPEASHMVQLEREAEFATTMFEFIQEHDRP